MTGVLRTIVSCIFLCMSFLYILLFHVFLVVSGMKVNQVPLSPSWSDLEVTEPQIGPDFLGSLSSSGKQPSRCAARRSLGPESQKSHILAAQLDACDKLVSF